MNAMRLHKKIVENSSISATEFFKINSTYADSDKQIDVVKLDMNSRSLSLLFKGNLYINHRTVFLVSLINLFQSLRSDEREVAPPYYAYTQSLVVFYLRKLAKHGLIKIISSERDKKIYLDDGYYTALGNAPTCHKITMYDIVFTKIRDLDARDIPLIKGIMRSFDIAETEIDFKVRSGLLKACHSRKNFRKNTYGMGEMVKRLSFNLKNTIKR